MDEGSIGKAREDIVSSVSRNHPSLKDDAFFSKIDEKLDEWESKVRRNTDARSHFRDQRVILRNAEYDLSQGLCEADHIREDISHIKELNRDAHPFDGQDLDALSKEERLDARADEQKFWNEQLTASMQEWELNEISKSRSAMIKSLDDWLKLIEEMKQFTDRVDPEGCGFLWDLVETDAYSSTIEELKRWLHMFNSDPEVKRICDLLGRMNSPDETETEEVIRTSFRTVVPDINSKEEIVSFELGNDLNNVVPHELAYLKDADMEVLFDLKFIERRLLCFAKSGYMDVEEFVEETISSSSESARGPMILCIDTSGSMNGCPEYIAKAVAFTLLMKAFHQNRRVLLVNFSVGIEVMELFKPKGIEDLLNFLAKSFSGGTDIFQAMGEVSRRLTTEEYSKSDVLFISDFVMPPDSFHEYSSLKSNGNRFYGLIIGDFLYNAVFDNEFFDSLWVYNPRTKSIDDLTTMDPSSLSNVADSICGAMYSMD